MKNCSIHLQGLTLAKQGGFMPSYWSAINLNSDRTPEITLGSLEDRVT
jgi:hypothetical protein